MSVKTTKRTVTTTVSKDAWLRGGVAAARNNNYGASTLLNVGTVKGQPRRILMVVPLTGVSGTVDSCKLNFNVDALANVTDEVAVGSSSSSSALAGLRVEIRRLLQTGWVEGTGTEFGTGPGPDTGDGATWDTYDGTLAWGAPGADLDGTDRAASPVVGARLPIALGSFSDWDVAPLAQAAVDASLTELHLIVELADETQAVGQVSFTSSDGSTAPTATVVYRSKLYVSWLSSGIVPKVSAPSATAFDVQVVLGTLFDGVTPHANHKMRPVYRLEGASSWTTGTELDLSAAALNDKDPKTITTTGLQSDSWYEWKLQVTTDNWVSVDDESDVFSFTTQPSIHSDTLEIITGDHHHFGRLHDIQRAIADQFVDDVYNHSVEQASLVTDAAGHRASLWIDVGDTAPYVKFTAATSLFSTTTPVGEDAAPPGDASSPYIRLEEDAKTISRAFLRKAEIDFSRVPFLTIPGNHDAPHMAHYTTYDGIDTSPSNAGAWALQARKDFLGYPPASGSLPSSPSPSSIFFGESTGEYFAFGWGKTLNIVLNVYRYSDQFPSSSPTHNIPASFGTTGSTQGWLWTLGGAQFSWLMDTLDAYSSQYPWVRIVLHNLMSGLGPPGIYGRGTQVNDTGSATNSEKNGNSVEWGGTPFWRANQPYGYESGVGHVKTLYDMGIHKAINQKVGGKCYVIMGHDHVWHTKTVDGIHYITVPRPAGQSSPYEDGFHVASGYGEFYNSASKPSTGYVTCETTGSKVTLTYHRSYLPIPTNLTYAEPSDGIKVDNAVVIKLVISKIVGVGTKHTGMALGHKLNHGSYVAASQDSVLDSTNRGTSDFLSNKFDAPGGKNFDPKLQDRS